MIRTPLTAAALALSIALASPSLATAQQHQHGAKPDSARKEMKHEMPGGMKHDMGGSGMKGGMVSAWKEMDAFHAVLASTYHPAADKGDFAPLKSKASTLAQTARAWADSKAPASCASAEHAKSVQSVATGSAELEAKVKSGAADAELKAAIAAIHDTFEKVEHACGGMAGMKHDKPAPKQ